MTSIPANVQNYLAGSRTGQPKVQAPEAKEDFGKVLSRQKPDASKESGVKTPRQTETAAGETVKTQEQRSETPQEAEAAAVQTEGGETGAERVDASQGQQSKSVETDADIAKDGAVQSELPQEGLEQAMEVLQSAIVQIQELLMQQLNLSPQELEQLMQREGVTDLQLLQPEVVNQLILDAAGAEDPMTLVTDEKLYRSQQTITQGHQEIVRGVQKELKDEGGLSKALESLESAAEGQALGEPVRTEEHQQQGESQEQPGRRKEHEPEQGESRSQNVMGQIIYQNYNAQAQNPATVGQTGNPIPAGAAYAEVPDSGQLMSQILDYMKVSMGPENTVLNMQLHPESLGTLHVQISAREGVMTAHFTASSEAVKTVLENQIAMLRENFEQQDIKVDAIEVTVETHQFESNLEQGRQRGEEEQGRRPRRRRLDAGSIEPGEELTESDQILTEMMAANGSSVDYLA